jgi:hypothetical protein
MKMAKNNRTNENIMILLVQIGTYERKSSLDGIIFIQNAFQFYTSVHRINLTYEFVVDKVD